MTSSQILGIRILCILLGNAVGYMLFGPDMVWLFGMKSFIWCGLVGGVIGTLIGGEPKK